MTGLRGWTEVQWVGLVRKGLEEAGVEAIEILELYLHDRVETTSSYT